MALAVAVGLEALRRCQSHGRRDSVFAAVLSSLVLCAGPIYRIRNAPWVEAARVSARVVRTISRDLAGGYTHGRVLLEDEAVRISNIRDAFGSLATEAIQLVTGQPLEVTVVIPPHQPSQELPPADMIAWYRLERGAVRRIE